MENRRQAMLTRFASLSADVLPFSFARWAKHTKDRKVVITKNTKVVAQRVEAESKQIASESFLGWRIQAMNERRAREVEEMFQERRRAVMRGAEWAGKERKRSFLAKIFWKWHAFAREEFMESIVDQYVLRQRSKSLELIFGRTAQIIMSCAFRDWSAFASTNRKERFWAEAYYNNSAEMKHSTVKAILFAMADSYEIQVKTMFTAWRLHSRHAVRRGHIATNALAFLSATSSFSFAATAFHAWCGVAKQCKRNARSKLSACRVFGQLAMNSDHLNFSFIFSAWRSGAEAGRARRTVRKAKQKVISVVADTAQFQLLYFLQWCRAVDQGKQVKARLWQADGIARLFVDELGCHVQSRAFGSWRRKVIQRRLHRESSSKALAARFRNLAAEDMALLRIALNKWLTYHHRKRIVVGSRHQENVSRQLACAQYDSLLAVVFLQWVRSVKGSHHQHVSRHLAGHRRRYHLVTEGLSSTITSRDARAFYVTAFLAWRDWRRLMAQQARSSQVAKIGLVRWIAADAMMVLSTWWRRWRHAHEDARAVRNLYDPQSPSSSFAALPSRTPQSSGHAPQSSTLSPWPSPFAAAPSPCAKQSPVPSATPSLRFLSPSSSAWVPSETRPTSPPGALFSPTSPGSCGSGGSRRFRSCREAVVSSGLTRMIRAHDRRLLVGTLAAWRHGMADKRTEQLLAIQMRALSGTTGVRGLRDDAFSPAYHLQTGMRYGDPQRF